MQRERRKGLPAVPTDLRTILSAAQKNALDELETFGWVVDYVRRPLFQEPRVIVRNPQSGARAIIDADGLVDHNPANIVMRNDDQ